MAVLDDFDIAAAEARRVARALTADQLGRPSKCAGWTVRDVLAHPTPLGEQPGAVPG